LPSKEKLLRTGDKPHALYAHAVTFPTQ